MPIEDFTNVMGEVLRDRRISLKAKGLFGSLAVMDADAAVSLEDLVETVPDGRDAVRAAVRELEQAGYLRRDRTRNADGTVGVMAYSVPESAINGGRSGSAPLAATGWAYAITDAVTGYVKIGCSRDVTARLGALRSASATALHLTWQAEGGGALERHLHQTFRHLRVRGEWFKLPAGQAVELLTTAAAQWAEGA